MLTADLALASDCRAEARTGDLRRAWTALVAATGATQPVLGPRGHGLRPDATGWQLLRAAGTDNRPDGWVPALAWLRLGMSEWLLAQAVDHLRARTSGGLPLIQQQLVRDGLADATIAHQEVLGLLETQSLPTYAHDRLTRADRRTLRLLGASGFLAGGPGELAYLSELVADAYLDGR